MEIEFLELRGSEVAVSATRRGGRRPYQTGLAGGRDPRAEISGIWKSVASRHCMRTDERGLKGSYAPKCVEWGFCEVRASTEFSEFGLMGALGSHRAKPGQANERLGAGSLP